MSTNLSPLSIMSTNLSPLSTMSTNLWSPSSTLLSSQNTTHPNQTTCPPHDKALHVPLAVFYSLFFLVGLAGNLLALWVFLFLQRRRDSMHVLLTNCAVADLLLLTCLPFRVQYLANGNYWELGGMACSLVTNVFYMIMYVNIAMLGLISLDRYAWLRRRAGGARCTARSLCGVRWTWVVCGLVWGLALGLMVYTISVQAHKAPDNKCFMYMRWSDARRIAYINVALEVMFWVVFIVQVVSYGKIAASRYGRTARKSFFVLFLFTVCFVPYHAFRPVYVLSQLDKSSSCEYMSLMYETSQVMLLFSAFNSCLDPVMYFLLSGLMRKVAARALCALCTHSYRIRDGE